MAASARSKTQGRSSGVRGVRSQGMENVALNEITTATCEPSENGDVKRFETHGEHKEPPTEQGLIHVQHLSLTLERRSRIGR